MGQNKGVDRSFFVMGGSVKKTGGSLLLSKGQLAAVDNTKTRVDGVQVISSFAGKRKDAKDFALKLGVFPNNPNRSYTNKSMSTLPFALEEITELRVSAPERTEMIMDEFTLGYNGIDDSSAFQFKKGDSYFQVMIGISGGAVAFRGGDGLLEYAQVKVELPRCDPYDTCVDCDNCGPIDCKAIVLEAIERLNRQQMTGGMLVSEAIEITPIFKCDAGPTAETTDYTYYTLSVCDTGGDEALALIQAQYDYPVKRLDRRGSISVYQILVSELLPDPADYVQGIASLIKGCDTCPDDYTATPEGFLYTFSIEDDGVDQSALITALPNYVANTIKRAPGHDHGVGYYTAVFSVKLTDAQIATFVTGAAPRNTATVYNNGKVSALCTNDDTQTFEWVAGEVCQAITQVYTINVPDDGCGNTVLAELQAAYPLYTVSIAQEDSVNSSRTVTLTGTSGTVNITIGGVDYTAVFATDLTTSAANFVTARGPAILAATGAVVTSAGAVITITYATTGFPTITATNVSGNLAGTVGTVTVIQQDVQGGCRTKYQAIVPTNIVCDECDDIYRNYYISQAPANYGLEKWTLVDDGAASSPTGNCLCGIRVKGKPFVLAPEIALREKIGFMETGTLVQGSAGYTEEIREGIGRLPKGAYEANYLTRFTPRTHLGGNLLMTEKESKAYFLGRECGDYLAEILRSETSNIEDLFKQYVHYTIVLDSFKKSGGFGKTLHESLEYHIYVGVGEHQDVEDLLNDLASNAGHDPVQAFGA